MCVCSNQVSRHPRLSRASSNNDQPSKDSALAYSILYCSGYSRGVTRSFTRLIAAVGHLLGNSKPAVSPSRSICNFSTSVHWILQY